MKKKSKPLHRQLADKIENCGLKKSVIFKALGISKYNFNRYLETGLITDVGTNRFKNTSHEISSQQKKIIRTIWL